MGLVGLEMYCSCRHLCRKLNQEEQEVKGEDGKCGDCDLNRELACFFLYYAKMCEKKILLSISLFMFALIE